MNTKDKFSKDKGGPISVGKGRSEQAKWKNNPKNKNYTDTFPVSVEMLQTFTRVENSTGIGFCNGCDSSGGFAPVMAAMNAEGIPLVAFTNEGEIPFEEFLECRDNWNKFHPGKDTPQFFFLGSEALLNNIEDFEVARYEAAFVEKKNGKDSAVLYGYSYNGMKDPGEEEEPGTCLNKAGFCPPFCGEEN